MHRAVSDTDTIRRQNRRLVLDAIRRLGPVSRTRLAHETGLSHATITAISTDMLAQGMLLDLEEDTGGQKSRGRPAVRLGFNRNAGYVLLFEIDVNKARTSLVDYGGVLVDRIEFPVTPETFLQTPPTAFVADRIAQMRERNPGAAGRIWRAAASVQGILDRDGASLRWSPVAGLSEQNLTDFVDHRFDFPLKLYKRGRLLAEGARLLFPQLHDANVATVFIGSTVAMGMSFRGRNVGRSEDAATEFGHMVHVRDGALCRCGTCGCIEAYAADYGVLRTAYGVPEKTPPAAAVPPSQYADLISRARQGERAAIHAFNLAGNAVGYGLNRLMTVFDPSHILVVGPGANAMPFMRQELEAALAKSLIGRTFGIPQILTHEDVSEPVFKGLMTKALTDLDQIHFAALPAAGQRAEVK